jgi:ubiquinone/menaquinone biosynthesis C-methylase UbiE
MPKSFLPPTEKRTWEELRQHYEVEKELGNRLRQASREERARLYAQVYDELFQRLPRHPQWTKQDTLRRDVVLRSQMNLLRPYLNDEVRFLEVGAGDCALAIRVAALVRQVYAVDVSDELTKTVQGPENFRLVLSDGCRIPLPDGSIDLAYSFQMMEHIHPEDAFEQLRELYRILRPGGIYYCVTPNRLGGPHDISRYFDREAQGLHLKEYSVRELVKLYREAGFRNVWAERIFRKRRVPIPMLPLKTMEGALELLPWRVRVALARSYAVSRLLNVSVLGRK